MSKDLLALQGIVTVLNTPFTKTNKIDLMSLERNIDYAVDAGVAGIVAPAMASEVDKLTRLERDEIVQTIVRRSNGRVPVIGGASAIDRQERLDIARRATAMGCDGVLIHLPYRDSAEYEREIRALAQAKPGFLMIQDWDFGGYGVPLDVIARLFEEIPCFRSFKIEVVPAGVKYTEVLERTNGKLHIAGGWAVLQMIEALDRGVHAFMPTGMHEIYTSIYRRYQTGEREKAQELFHRVLPVLAFSNQHLDISIHFFKRLLYRQGIYDTPLVRQPTLAFDRYHQRIADEWIEHVIGLIGAINRTNSPVG